MNALILGVDPDTTCPGVGALDGDGRLLSWTAPVSRDRNHMALLLPSQIHALARNLVPLSGWQQIHLVVEAQYINPRGRVPATDIVDLARCAGIAMGTAAMLQATFTDAIVTVTSPPPMAWKGNVTKQNHHPLLLKRWPVLIDDFFLYNTPKRVQADVLDALGLALWFQEGGRHTLLSKPKHKPPNPFKKAAKRAQTIQDINAGDAD